MSFVQLRNSPHAQREIRIAAEALEKFFKELMPVTHRTFIENGRIAP
jgi:thymidylate synthase ThyX